MQRDMEYVKKLMLTFFFSNFRLAEHIFFIKEHLIKILLNEEENLQIFNIFAQQI